LYQKGFVKKVLLYSQKLKDEDSAIIKYLCDLLTKNSFSIYSFPDLEDDLESMSHHNDVIPVKEEDLNQEGIEMVITLGGDGTMLKAASIVAKMDIPIIGINLGRLGFLSSVEKSKVHDAVLKIKAGLYHIETRSMLQLSCNLPIFQDYPYSLNDFTIHKRDTSSMITIHTFLDGTFLNTYWADGIIVSTPTGSTGYSLACGGPIIFPDSKNFVITPIAPHNLNVRPIIINDDVKISFEIEGRAENFLCTMDSNYETITDEYKLTINKADIQTKLIILDNHNFSNTIREKLLWGLDKRN
jgi:NAD+ kinase